MVKADKSKRSFFKKAAAAVGFFSAAGYLGKWMVARNDSVQQINDHCANDISKQKTAWLQKQFLPMTENDKQQMLDEIIDSHNKNHA